MNHAIHKITFVLWYFDELEKLLLLNAYSDREELIFSIIYDAKNQFFTI